MVTAKNVKEIYQHLFDDGIVKNIHNEVCIRLRGNNLVCLMEGKEVPTANAFLRPEEWRLVDDSQWYDKIPPQGYICWVYDFFGDEPVIDLIVKTVGGTYESKVGNVWDNARPATIEELAEKGTVCWVSDTVIMYDNVDLIAEVTEAGSKSYYRCTWKNSIPFHEVELRDRIYEGEWS